MRSLSCGRQRRFSFLVVTGHSRSKNRVLKDADVPVTLLRNALLSKRDGRDKPGHDRKEKRSKLMTQTDKMLSRKEGKIGYLTFNNPERHNAVSLDMWEAASGFLEDFKKDNNIRVVVVTGAGGKAFISGADISKFEKERSTQEGVDRYNAAVDQAN